MAQVDKIKALATVIGVDYKALKLLIGNLSSLTTQQKTNLVLAINELDSQLGDLTLLTTDNKNTITDALNELKAAVDNAILAAGAQIDDTATDGNKVKTWSADKIFDEILTAKQEVKSDILDGADAALDTLKELGTELKKDQGIVAALTTDIANRVRYDSAQSLTLSQQKQACENIGIGDPDTDFVATYNTAKA